MTIDADKLTNIIVNNKDKKKIAKTIIEKNPQVLSVIPKLKADPENSQNLAEGRINANLAVLIDIHNKISNNRENNKAIIELFPDIEMSIQIIVSSILSPKKMTDTTLNYRIDKKKNILPSISKGVLDILKDYLNDNYDFEEDLPEILRQALFETGSYVQLIVPEASLDELINKELLPSYSTEEFKAKVDFVRERHLDSINLESYNPSVKEQEGDNDVVKLAKMLISTEVMNITDNPNILQYSDLTESVRSSIVRSTHRRNNGVSMEDSKDKLGYLDIFRKDGHSNVPETLARLKTKSEASRASIGRPMMIDLPSESVIPIGNFAYLVMLDERGKPLDVNDREKDLSNISSSLSINPNERMTPIKKAYKNLISNSTCGVNTSGLFEIYKALLEKEIYNSVKTSIYDTNIDISNKNDIYYIMFVRALAGRRTSLLYVPKDLITYYAFQYNDIGVGKSLLENLAVLSSLRSILLFSKVMGQVKQSIDMTKVTISLDPDDPDPEKSIEQMQDSILKLRQNYMPLGINNFVDIVNWLNKAGLQFEYENNPLIPDVKVTFDNNNMQHTIPDTDLDEDLRKQTILAFGLSPEVVDNSFSPDFATTVTSNNLLLARRISIYQKKFCRFLTSTVEKIMYNDEDLRAKIKEVILEDKEALRKTLDEDESALFDRDESAFYSYYLDKISDSVIISLPQPEATTLENMKTEFLTFEEGLDKVLEYVISTDMFTEDMVGDVSQHVDSLRAVVKAYYIRRWMSENDYMTEVLELAGGDEDEVTAMLGVMSDNLAGTMSGATKLFAMMRKYRIAAKKDLSDVFNDEDTDSFSSSDSYSSDDSSSDDGSSDDTGGDDFSAGGDDDGMFDFGE